MPSDTPLADLLTTALNHHQSRRFAQAEELYRQVLANDPEQCDALHLLGMLEHERGRHQTGIDHVRHALDSYLKRNEGKIDTSVVAAFISNLGVILRGAGRREEAVAAFRDVIQIHTTNGRREAAAGACNNLGNVYRDCGDHPESEKWYREAIQLEPNFADAHNHLSLCLQDQGRAAEALAAGREAVRLRPDYPEGLMNLGNLLPASGDWPGGMRALDAALARRPEWPQAHLNRAILRLTRGEFVSGFAEYEWRFKALRFREFDRPRWDGSPLQGRTILLHSEQGLGDALQFIRYAELVKASGGRVLVQCQESLVTLLERTTGIDQVVGQKAALPEFAVHAPLLSLPHILETTVATIPANIPYLFADPEDVDRWRRRLAGTAGLKVGLAWQGSPTHYRDRDRSIALSRFSPLQGIRGIRLISLQQGSGSQQLPQGSSEILNPGLESGTFLETAALVRNLDLVITVDTAVAHLAGGLGIPVWLLVTAVPDWRWLLDREDSPWYPTVRVFRQAAPGQWDPLIAQVAHQLRAFPDHMLNISREATHLRPAEPEPHQKLGHLLRERNDLPGAIASFRRATRLWSEQAPQAPEAFDSLSLALQAHYQQQSRLELPPDRQQLQDILREIVEACRIVIRHRPHQAEAHQRLGMALLELGERDQAAKCFQVAVQLATDPVS